MEQWRLMNGVRRIDVMKSVEIPGVPHHAPAQAVEVRAPVAPTKGDEHTPEASSWGIPGIDSLIPRGTSRQDFDDLAIPLTLWKTNISANAGQPLIRRYEGMWIKLHENNIDLGRAAEVGSIRITLMVALSISLIASGPQSPYCHRLCQCKS